MFSKNNVNVINLSSYMAYVTVAGGGQTFASEYLKHGGASKTIAGIHIPYGKQAFIDFIGDEVEKYVSVDAARLLAKRSYQECCKATYHQFSIGLAATCSLATTGEREGRIHKIMIAVHCYYFTSIIDIELEQGKTRHQEEKIVKDLLFRCLYYAAINNKPVEANKVVFKPYKLAQTTIYRNRFEPYYVPTKIGAEVGVIYPGSWNPFHDGHKQIHDLAQRKFNEKPILELCLNNADKGVLDFLDVEHRHQTIGPDYHLVLTNCRTFIEKARYFKYNWFKKVIFVVGVDTWNRILDERYAGPINELFKEFRALNTFFYVVSRNGIKQKSHKLMNKLVISDDDALEFDNPISSTELRNK